jgi:hypothetical protein
MILFQEVMTGFMIQEVNHTVIALLKMGISVLGRIYYFRSESCLWDANSGCFKIGSSRCKGVKTDNNENSFKLSASDLLDAP